MRLSTYHLRKPYSYQKACLETYGSSSNGHPSLTGNIGFALYWQMRLGKSLVAIRFLKRQAKFRPIHRVLIVCPKSTIVSWYEELKLELVNPIIFSSKEKEIHKYFKKLWAITNYETLTCKGVYLHKLPWDAIILDESHRIKNPKAKITKFLTDSTHFPPNKETKQQFRFCLTGTPAPETYLDYFCQYKFLRGSFMECDNFYKFRLQNFQTSWKTPGKYLPKQRFHREIASFFDSDKTTSILSRAKAGVDLPNVYQKRIVSLPDKWRKIYDSFEKDWYTKFMLEVASNPNDPRSFAQLETKWATVAQNYLHQMACGFPKQLKSYQSYHKVKEVQSLLEENLADEKVVIWCRYLNDIARLMSFLSSKTSRRPAKIDGSTDLPHLRAVLDSFRASPVPSLTHSRISRTGDVDTLICQIRKAGQGMDLSAANTQIFFSRSWSLMENIQAADRLIHPEKKNDPAFQGLLTIDIVCENTVDEDVHNALVEKKANASIFKYFLDRTAKFNLTATNGSN